MRKVLLVSSSLLALSGFGCAPAASTPAKAPEGAEPAPVETAKAPEKPKTVSLPAAPSAVPAPSKTCQPFVTAAAEGTPTCSSEGLAKALSVTDVRARDAALVGLEQCSELPRGIVRALRAELAPAECSDAIVADAVAQAGESTSREVTETLVALAQAGRLRRLAANPPAPPATHDKPTLQAYFKDTLFPWISQQAKAINDISVTGAALHGYAQGVVAIEAGMADMRFVEIARNVPIPKEMEGDAELRNVYYASLDEALEPRKARGRDAALVGMGQLAHVGVLHSPRLDAARALLSRVYGAHRIDALDRLILPPLPPLAKNPAAELELAARVPTFYAPFVVPQASANEPSADELSLFRASLEQGVPAAQERALSASAPKEPALLLLSRAHLELGRTYFRAEDFATVERKLRDQKNDDAAFLHALATALLAGPKNAADLIRRGPRFADALGNLEALDKIAEGKGPWAGAAAFDSAYLRELVAPEGDAAFWQDLEARYALAARGLSGTERKEAQARATAARDTARALAKR
jgi:hypothetical protein